MIDDCGEATRDQRETAFTPALRRIIAADSGVLAAAFVDSLGETIDYCSRVDPFEAKVAAAELHHILGRLSARFEQRGRGRVYELAVHGTTRDLLVRRVTEEHAVVVVVRARSLSPSITESVELAVYSVRRESCIAIPPWDPQAAQVAVVLRLSSGWGQAPAAVVDPSGVVHQVEVLGRSDEDRLRLYRVRTASGEEISLLHDEPADRWMRL